MRKNKWNLLEILTEGAMQNNAYSATYLKPDDLKLFVLCNTELIVANKYCVIQKYVNNSEDLIVHRHFDKKADADHEQLVLKIKGIKTLVYSKSYCTKAHERYSLLRDQFEQLRKIDKEISNIVDDINELHRDIRTIFDCASKEFAEEEQANQSVKIYKLLRQLSEKTYWRHEYEKSIEGSYAIDVDEYSRPNCYDPYHGDIVDIYMFNRFKNIKDRQL